jgi:hypothetical protein
MLWISREEKPITAKYHKQTRSEPASSSNREVQNAVAVDRRKKFIENTVEVLYLSQRTWRKHPLGGRRQLVSKPEAAFTHYIDE